MKFINTKLFTLLTLVCSLSFTSCKPEKDVIPTNDSKIEGDWTLKSEVLTYEKNGAVDGEYKSKDVGQVFNFKSGGVLSVSEDNEKYTWNVKENKFLNFSYDKFEGYFSSIEGEILTLNENEMIVVDKRMISAEEAVEKGGVDYEEGAIYSKEVKLSFGRN